ncbi:MAG TPA: type 2 lanthipeptide synthetase LanM family protein [Herpetosiphonaceae bacterium]
MSRAWLHDPSWYHALTLAERIGLLRENPQSRAAEINAELGTRRMQHWQTQAPFADTSFFEQRLAQDGIDEAELLYLLSEPITAVRDRADGLPDWLLQLAEAFAEGASSSPVELPPALQSQETAQFLDLIEPLIRQGRERLRAGIAALVERYAAAPFDPTAAEAIMYAQLTPQLLPMISRVLVLELNVARLQGLLQGETAQERFQSFLQRLIRHDHMLPVLQEYAALARLLTQRINAWVAVSLEFLSRLCADWPALRALLSLESDPGHLAAVDGAVGDRHRGGRSVLIASFDSGRRLVYKPRSMSVDVHFQQLLEWLNRRGSHPPFRTLRILDRETYGWVEFVAAQSCTSLEEVQRFYRRQGAYLALLYVLEATDFHFENLIAAGEQPVLIDLESLFHPRPAGEELGQTELLVSDAMSHSVLRVGLLPQRSWSNAESEGVDLSGLGAIAGQLSPNAIPYWEGGGTDEMRLARKRMVMRGGQNRPLLNGAEVELLDFADQIVDGCTTMYRLLLRERDALLAADGPLVAFAADEIRIIMRPTHSYALLLGESYHPDLLRSTLNRDRHFDRLWVGVDRRPDLIRLIPAERADLHRGDIPMFTSRPSSCDVWSSTGERISGFFDATGLHLVQQRLGSLSEEDLQRQLWFVNASLATLAINLEPDRGSRYLLAEPQQLVDRERLLVLARAVGDRLDVLALRAEDGAAWIGLTFERNSYWKLAPLGADLYSGLPGIALFLAQLGALTREQRYTELAQAALSTLRRLLNRERPQVTLIGAFNGWGGVCYVLAQLGALWSQPELLREAELLAESLPALIADDNHFDIVSGAAGCILSLLSVYRCTSSPRTLDLAIQCGERLLTTAQPQDHGIGWSVPTLAPEPMLGFSHGVAGIALALGTLAAASGQERFQAAASAALSYERSRFVPERGNWPDLRTAQPDQAPPFLSAWCHGAPGIGLSRLGLLPQLEDADLRAEIEIALQTTCKHGFGLNHSLCHGDLGNLELLLQAGMLLDDPHWQAETRRIASLVVESIDRHGWRSGIPLGVESPGLMTGLAGIGYGLLRLAAPEQVPSVLLLAPPVLHDPQD